MSYVLEYTSACEQNIRYITLEISAGYARAAPPEQVDENLQEILFTLQRSNYNLLCRYPERAEGEERLMHL